MQIVPRFTPRSTNFSVFLLDKTARGIQNGAAVDEPGLSVPVWRRPQVAAHRHQEHELNIVVEGSARYHWWDDRGHEGLRTVGPGQLLAIPGGLLHKSEVDVRAVVRGMWIHPDHLTSLPSCPALNPYTQFLDPVDPRHSRNAGFTGTAQDIFSLAQGELGRESRWRSEMVRTQGQLAALLFLRVMESAAMPTDATPQTQIDEFVAWLDRNYMQRLSLTDMARRAGCSRSHFCALFTAKCGCPPGRYLLQRRLHHAATLLESMGFSVQQVGQMSGFEHEASFIRAFAAEFGISPGAYRKKCK